MKMVETTLRLELHIKSNLYPSNQTDIPADHQVGCHAKECDPAYSGQRQHKYQNTQNQQHHLNCDFLE